MVGLGITEYKRVASAALFFARWNLALVSGQRCKSLNVNEDPFFMKRLSQHKFSILIILFFGLIKWVHRIQQWPCSTPV